MIKIKKDQVTTRTYSYKQGEVSLSFALQIDTSEQLSAFKKCLKAALEDITETLEKVENGS